MGKLAYARMQEVLTPPGGAALITRLGYPAGSTRVALTTVTRTGDGTQTSRYLFNALEQMVSRATNAPGGPAGVVHYIHGLDGALLAEAGGATGKTLRDYIWLPQGDASPAADNDNEEGGSSPPLPLALVTAAGTQSPQLLMVHADNLGRPVRLTDATRATVWSASYDPFGQPCPSRERWNRTSASPASTSSSKPASPTTGTASTTPPRGDTPSPTPCASSMGRVSMAMPERAR